MAKQLIVAFVVLVALTQQSFSHTYKPGNAGHTAETHDPKENNDGNRVQTDMQSQYTTSAQDSNDPTLNPYLSWMYGQNQKGNKAETGKQSSEHGQDNAQHQGIKSCKDQKDHESGAGGYSGDRGQENSQDHGTETNEDRGDSHHSNQGQLGSSYGHRQDQGHNKVSAGKQSSGNSQESNQDRGTKTGKDEKDSHPLHQFPNPNLSYSHSQNQQYNQLWGMEEPIWS